MRKDRAEVERQVQEVLKAQHSLITSAQALECGMTYNRLASETAAARLVRVVNGLYRDARSAETPQQAVMAAVLAHPGEAFAYGGTARPLYGVGDFSSDRPHLAVEQGHHHKNPLATVHQISGLRTGDTRVADGIPCLSPQLTLLTLAADSDATYDQIEAVLVAFACKGLVSVRSVLRCADRFAARGRNGTVLLRAVAGHWQGKRLPQSPKELELGRLLDQLGYGPVEYQRPIEVAGGVTLHADIGLPGRPVVIEYQSDAHHSTRKARREDSSRTLRMRATGLEVLPATQDDIDSGAVDLVAAIRRIDVERAA